MKNKQNNKGFVLAEIVVSVLIVMLALGMSAQLFMLLNQDYKVMVSYLSSYVKGREIIDLISKDTRIAIRVMDSYGGYTTTDNCLVLKMPSITSSGDIININKDFDYIIYRLIGGNLWKIVLPGANSSRTAYNNIVKKNIESLSLTSDDIPFSSIPHKTSITHLTMQVSISETFMGRDYRVNPGTTIKLMNYEWEFVR